MPLAKKRHILKETKRRQSQKHPDFPMELWILVRSYRILLRTGVIKTVLKKRKPPIKKGKTPSIRQVCDELAERGGYASVVGGKALRLAEANAKRRTGKWSRIEATKRSEEFPPPLGTIFVNHLLTNPETLRARYQEANQIASNDRRVWLFWRNVCRQRLGYPIEKPLPQSGRRGSA